MSKFLKLIEEHDPATKRRMVDSSKAKKSKFLEILEQYDPANEQKREDAFKAKMLLHEKKRRFKKKKYAEEDESINATTGTYEVDKEVEGLAGKASGGLKGLAGKLFGTSAQKAKSAVKERQNLANQAVDAYRKGSVRIKKGLQSVKQTATGRTY
jgi:hypothetical protein